MTAFALLQTITLVALFIAFVGLILWVFRPKSKSKYDKYSEMPLQDDINNEENK